MCVLLSAQVHKYCKVCLSTEGVDEALPRSQAVESGFLTSTLTGIWLDMTEQEPTLTRNLSYEHE